MKLRALWPSRPINKVKNQLPQTAPKMKFYYKIYIPIAHICQPFEGLVVKMLVKPHLKLVSSCQYCRYAAKQRGLAPLILLSKVQVVDFFWIKSILYVSTLSHRMQDSLRCFF